MPFDPCREWLGIEALDLGDPRRVLGIPVSLTDPDAIAAAAEARLATLRRINPGPFARAREALVARVEEARQTLLQHAAAAGPPPPAWQASPVPREAPKLVSGSRPDPWGTLPDALSPEGEELPTGIPAFRTKRVGAAPRQDGSKGDLTGLVLGLGALLATVAAVIAYVVLQPPAGSKPVSQVAVAPPPVSPRPASPPETRRTPAPRVAPERPADPRPADAPTRPLPQLPADSAADEEAGRRAAEEARRAAEEQRRQERQLVTRQAIDAALRDAYAALQRQEFDAADRAITAAGRQVGDDVEAATRIERWRLLATYARGFAGHRGQAFKAANEGREYDLGDTRFAVIEITPEKFVYKLRGKTERTTPDKVDPRIALAIVEAWFAADGRAANHLFLGAHAACLDPPDLRRARREWQVAGQEGEQAAPLLALLDDPVFRRAGDR
jgi:hypothetical protein